MCFSAAGVIPGVIPGVVPGVTTRTIEVMPSSLGARENGGDSVYRPAPPEVDRRLSTVEVPSQPPVLTSGAARALVRILLRANRSGSDATVPEYVGPDGHDRRRDVRDGSGRVCDQATTCVRGRWSGLRYRVRTVRRSGCTDVMLQLTPCAQAQNSGDRFGEHCGDSCVVRGDGVDLHDGRGSISESCSHNVDGRTQS